MNQSKPKTTIYPLFLNHLIFLSREQRYDLYSGAKLKVLGTCIEITNINNDKEYKLPKEIFLEYEIDTEQVEDKVQISGNYYKIHVPIKYMISDLEDNKKIEETSYETVYSEDILDNDDGGKEEYFFRFKKIYVIGNKRVISVHSVEIRDITVFENSSNFIKFS
jgi:hypothetical protein